MNVLIRIVAFLVAALGIATQAAEPQSGGWRLGQESSPYLRMHADNPVQWYAWGDEAFAKAKAENKPLFISIGYFTCHWCHVMERESFSDPEIARLLNDGFVSIKIDREQRPDIDAAYMHFVQMTTGSGGWPMSVWATSDGNPFLGGTYFPPQAKYGRAGLKDLLPKISKRWAQDQNGLVAMSKRAVEVLRQRDFQNRTLDRLDKQMLTEAQRRFRESYDDILGGFGSAPKFPRPGQLLFLLMDKNAEGKQMALYTLDKMAAGGIVDQLGGGFHRYSTDPEWHVPHFEKMLYDQALITRPYLLAYQQTKNPFYAQVARATLDFVLDELRDSKGGFYSALSADSLVSAGSKQELAEGAFYGWSWNQWKNALESDTLRAWGASRFGVEPNGNVHGGELSGSNVLYLAKTVAALAKQLSISYKDAREREQAVRTQLIKTRNTRPPVPVDDKVVSAWNGYMIATLARAAETLQDDRYTQAAQDAAEFMLRELYDSKRRILYRDWRAGRRGVPGFAEDYGAMAEGLLALYKITGDKRWLQSAREFTDIQIERFWDEKNGGFFGTTSNTRLWVRNKKATDGVTPSHNSIAIHNLLRLSQILDKPEYFRYAKRTAMWVGGLLQGTPDAMPYTLIEWPALMAGIEPADLKVTPKER
ncbi:MAG: thioredoxin domain-containing protein [Gammaproteobacteria bacterium]